MSDPIVIDKQGCATSALLCDRSDSHEQLRRSGHAAGLAEDDSEALLCLADDGYCLLGLDAEQSDLGDVTAEAIALWGKGLPDMQFQAADQSSLPFSRSHELIDRLPGYSIPDLHRLGAAATKLLADERLLRALGVLFECRPVVLHTAFSEWGGVEPITRGVEPITRLLWFLPPVMGANCCSVWIPLEDVHPKGGPIAVYPGTHRWSYPEFARGDFAPGEGLSRPEAVLRARAELTERIATLHCAGLVPNVIPGLALVMHPSLVTRDMPLINAGYTRRGLLALFGKPDLI